MNYEKEISDNSSGNTVKQLHYVFAPDGLAAVIEVKNNMRNIYYAQTDHLGSLNLLVREDGSVAEDLSYDAWGRRRNADNWQSYSFAAPSITSRGYTFHEHLDDFNLINMNGRVYDPQIGQFLSPDPFVQSPEFSQSYNRYSYCFNNPLKFTDPSGYSSIFDPTNILWWMMKSMEFWAARQAVNRPQNSENSNQLSLFNPESKVVNLTLHVEQENEPYRWTSDPLDKMDQRPTPQLPNNEVTGENELAKLDTRSLAEYVKQGNFEYDPLQDKDKLSSFFYSDIIQHNNTNKGPTREAIWGAVGSTLQEMYYSKTYKTWMGKNFKIYKQYWGGNMITGGKNKFAKTTSNIIKWGGRALGVWNSYNIQKNYLEGKMSTGWMLAEQGTNAISSFGGIYGAAWGIGWELGRALTTLDAYQEFKFNFWYDRMVSEIGPPGPCNEGAWYDFFNNYGHD